MNRSQDQTRERVLETTVQLLRRQGYHGTGLSQIAEESGAEDDSLGMHFPRGKEQLATEAIEAEGARTQGFYHGLVSRTDTPGAALEAVFEQLINDLVASDWRSGCPVAAVSQEMAPHSEVIRETCSDTFHSWAFVIEQLLARFDVADDAREDYALLILSSIEGALLLARTHRSTAPLEAVKESLRRLLT